LVTDKDDQYLISATSEWLAIDLNSRKPININDFKIELPDHGVKALDEKLSRLNPKRFGEGLEIFEVNVPFSGIDENGHVNNAEYVKWSLDGLRMANIEIAGISTLQISFISEIFEKETCKIFFKQDEDGSKLVWGVNAKNNEYVFAMKIEKN
ncbi:MAG: thioesterase, partial [Vicinamibacterales bacterium]|nr:thioesterase [Vicinamibacterales bacterium]